MELHKRGHEMREQRQSKWFCCIYSSFVVENCSSISKMTLYSLSAFGNDDRMLRSKFLAICKCPGGRNTIKSINYQMSDPGTHRASNAWDLPGGCSRMELTRT